MAKKIEAVKRELWRVITALILVALSLFLFLSILTFNSHDSGLAIEPDLPANDPIHNAGGYIGATIAGHLLGNIGIASFALIALMIIWAIAVFRGKDIGNVWLRILGTIVFVFSFSALLGSLMPDGYFRIPGSIGLAAGDFFSTSLGRIGSILLFSLFFILSSLLVIERLLFDLASYTWKRICLVYAEKMKARELEKAAKAKTANKTKDKAYEIEKDEEAERKKLELEAAALEARYQEAVAAKESDFEEPEEDQDIEEPAEKESYDEPDEDIVEEQPVFVSESTTQKSAAVAVEEKKPRRRAREKDKDDTQQQIIGTYILPDYSLLEEPVYQQSDMGSLVEERTKLIESLFNEFNIDAKVVSYDEGPSVTQFELKLAPGIKINKVLSLHDNLSMALKATSLRIVAPIPGKATIGIEVPNQEQGIVKLRDILESPEFKAKKNKLHVPVLIGKNTSGDAVYEDLTKMPHLLIAGATGSGKSVCLNSLIVGILMLKSPDEVKMILVDPKMVELSSYRDIPHLMTPVVTDMKKASMVMEWAVNEMENRYARFHEVGGVRNIVAYNKWVEERIKAIEAKKAGLETPDTEEPSEDDIESEEIDNNGDENMEQEVLQDMEGEENGDETDNGEADIPADEDDEEIPTPMPFITVIVDELADLMMVAAKEIEMSITRLAQKSRATGIHVVLATQRPSVDVITGLIKANLPSRLSFQVSSKVDSRTILDQNGAEKLLGRGDMLFLPPGTAKLIRAQGTYISDAEISRVVDYVKEQRLPVYNEEIINQGIKDDAGTSDDVYNDAVRVVLENQRGSVSLLQRKLGIGYTRAAKLIEVMEAQGILGPHRGSKPREIFITLDEWLERQESSGDAEEY